MELILSPEVVYPILLKRILKPLHVEPESVTLPLSGARYTMYTPL